MTLTSIKDGSLAKAFFNYKKNEQKDTVILILLSFTLTNEYLGIIKLIIWEYVCAVLSPVDLR